MTESMTELYHQYHESLVRMLTRRTGDRDRAEDLAQETFARAVAAPPNNPRPWLFAVALNLVREDGRKYVRQGRRLQLLKAETVSTAPAADEEFERRQNVADVRAALATLSDRDREAPRSPPPQGGRLQLQGNRRHARPGQERRGHHAGARPQTASRGVSTDRRRTRSCRTLKKAPCTPCWMAN